MFTDFFYTLRSRKIPVTITEWMTLMEALDKGFINSLDDFYYLARAILVKSESLFDQYDIAFGEYFKGIEGPPEIGEQFLDWLKDPINRMILTEEEQALYEQEDLEELMRKFEERMKQQTERHDGGGNWVGTGGTSPFGAYGYNPEGIRIGQDEGRNQRAIKVWDRRNYRDLDDSVEIGTRNIKMALRRLRKFARTGADEELDMDDTISSTARNAGLLDIKMVPERHNSVKVILFFDVGGSMDPHVKLCEELFSAARSEFKHLKYYYFHNFVYESVWTKSHRRHAETTDTFEIINKYTKDYKLIFVGDATMAPYEITHVGGSIEHYNEEAGAVWIKRLTDHFDQIVWINPTPKDYWEHSYSIEVARELVENRMFPLSVKGLEESMTLLTK